VSSRYFKTILLTVTSAALLGAPTAFAASTGSFSQFSNAAATSSVNVDYSPIAKFSETFGKQERGRTKISYSAVEQQGKRFLNAYINRLSNVHVSSLTRDDQLAYWLNTHNMLVMQVMTDPKGRRDMRKARGTAEAPGELWTQKRIKVDLADAGRAHLKKNLKVKGSKAQIPAVMHWHAEDLFGGDNDALRSHLASLSSDKQSKKLANATTFEARKFSYASDELVIREQNAYTGGNSFGGGGAGGGGGGGS